MNKGIAHLGISDLRIYPAIYHSLQTPGWVSWSSVVQLDSGDVLVGLNEVTGCRCPRVPAPLPAEAAVFGSDFYNFRGLDSTFKIIRCEDVGDPFLARWHDYCVEPLEDSVWPPSIYVLLQTANGTLLRQTQGRRLPRPFACGAVSRSEDAGRTWQPFQPVTAPDRPLYLCRVIQLRDERLLMSAYDKDNGNFLLVSGDDGRSWSEPIPAMVNDAQTWHNECAPIELANGDIMMMSRSHDLTEAQSLDAWVKKTRPGSRRRQVRMEKRGDTWAPGPITCLDIPYSGHPEVITTREGVLLYSSTDGFWGSDDEGETWTRIETLPQSAYYPHSVQLEDGRILVTGHNGGDSGYPPTADMMLWKVSFRITPPPAT